MADFSGAAAGIDLETLLRGSSGTATTNDNINLDDNDDDEADPYTELIRSHSNEVASPSLLPLASTETIELLIKNQQLVVASTPTGPIEALKQRVLKSELERVKYFYVDYKRTRLRKIEEHFLHYSRRYPDGICRTTGTRYLSDEEWTFLTVGSGRCSTRMPMDTICKSFVPDLVDKAAGRVCTLNT